jgi:hypothetical protein
LNNTFLIVFKFILDGWSVTFQVATIKVPTYLPHPRPRHPYQPLELLLFVFVFVPPVSVLSAALLFHLNLAGLYSFLYTFLSVYSPTF